MSGKPEVIARKTQVSFDWADGFHTFRLPTAQLEELQELTDAGPGWVKARLETGSWLVRDVIQTIRLGLIGGGMAPEQARKLVQRYVEARPLFENVPVARKILEAACTGVKDEALPKSEGEGTTKSLLSPSPEEKSASETFMAKAPQSATRRAKPATSASGS